MLQENYTKVKPILTEERNELVYIGWFLACVAEAFPFTFTGRRGH